MLLPFEGMGVDTVWRLEVPKAANSFDHRSVADVLLTIEYTALEDPGYRHAVIRSLAHGYSADRLVSLQAEFPDAWYDLNNPDTVEDPTRRMAAVLALTREDFPPNVADLSLGQLTLFAVRADSSTEELTVIAARHTLDGQATDAGPVTTVGGIVGTRRAGGAPWMAFLGGDPTGTWELQLEDTPRVRSLLQDGSIRDLALALTVTGTTPSWP
jgi:hypothetical protein